MSLYKKLFGYFLILFSLLTILMIGLPQIFSANNSGRIDKEIKIDEKFLINEKANIVLLYFGYVGCDTICVPSLSEINTIYSQVSNKKNISVYFVNLLTNIDKDLPQLFASHFNKDFKGIYLNSNELKITASNFNVNYSKSLTNNYELNHAGYLYLLEKDIITQKYKQKYIYTSRPYATQLIIKDINKLLKIKD